MSATAKNSSFIDTTLSIKKSTFWKYNTPIISTHWLKCCSGICDAGCGTYGGGGGTYELPREIRIFSSDSHYFISTSKKTMHHFFCIVHDYKVQYRVWYRTLSTISIALITVSCPKHYKIPINMQKKDKNKYMDKLNGTVMTKKPLLADAHVFLKVSVCTYCNRDYTWLSFIFNNIGKKRVSCF